VSGGADDVAGVREPARADRREPDGGAVHDVAGADYLQAEVWEVRARVWGEWVRCSSEALPWMSGGEGWGALAGGAGWVVWVVGPEKRWGHNFGS
jgi:hypothetical protein